MNASRNPFRFGRDPEPAMREAAGMTLVELLVVVVIAAIFSGLLVRGAQSVRESSRRLTCGSRLAHVVRAAAAHKSLIGHYPTGGWNQDWFGMAGEGGDWRQPGGWCFVLLPYLEQQGLYDLSAENPSAFVSSNVPIFTCPTRRASGLVAATATASKNGGTVSLGAGPWMRTDFAGNRGAWSSTPATPAVADVTNRSTTFGFVGGQTPPENYPQHQTAAWEALRASFHAMSSTLNQSQFPPASTANDSEVYVGWAGTLQSSAAPKPVPTGGLIYVGSAVTAAMIADGEGTTYAFAEKYLPSDMYTAAAAPGNEQSAYVGDSSSTLRGGQRPPESDKTPWPADAESQAAFVGVFGGPHAGVFNAAMCDGVVKPIAFDIDPGVHFFLSARGDRETVMLPQ